jgi:hypothetical protein
VIFQEVVHSIRTAARALFPYGTGEQMQFDSRYQRVCDYPVLRGRRQNLNYVRRIQDCHLDCVVQGICYSSLVDSYSVDPVLICSRRCWSPSTARCKGHPQCCLERPSGPWPPITPEQTSLRPRPPACIGRGTAQERLLRQDLISFAKSGSFARSSIACLASDRPDRRIPRSRSTRLSP